MSFSRLALCALALLGVLSTPRIKAAEDSIGPRMIEAANDFLKTLEPDELEKVSLPFDSPMRTEWRITPKTGHKGLPLKNLTEEQKSAALDLIRLGISQFGRQVMETVMSYESVVELLEKVRSKQFRDPAWYFINVYGKPGEGRWGYSFEGHHVSLNFTLDGDKLVSSTPQAFGITPIEFRGPLANDEPDGVKPLSREEQLGLEIAKSFTPEQKAVAVVAPKPAKELRNHGAPQLPADPPQGIEFSQLDDSQKSKLKEILNVFTKTLNDDSASQRTAEIEVAGWDNVRFAWRGGTESGEPHSFCIEGPTVYFELSNAQSDPVGNLANHVHAVYRDPRGDFGIPAAAK